MDKHNSDRRSAKMRQVDRKRVSRQGLEISIEESLMMGRADELIQVAWVH